MLIYECEKCETALSPGLWACPQCGDPFDEPVPADTEPETDGLMLPEYVLPTPRYGAGSLPADGVYLYLQSPAHTALVPKPLPLRRRPETPRAFRRAIPFLLVLGVGLGLEARHFRQSRHNLLGALLTQHTITYRITGTVPVVDVTYQNGLGGTEQISDVRIPWQQTYTVNAGTYLYLSAQSRGKSGRVITEIDVDGAPRKTAATDGAYTTVYVNDSL